MALNFRGVELPDEQVRHVAQKLEEAQLEKSYVHPWESLESDLRSRDFSHLTLVAYGSLVNSASAKETIQNQTSVRTQPVIAFGVRRIFNYPLPLEVMRYGPPHNLLARAALNVRVTGNIQDAVNGLLWTISLDNLPALRARELDYDLIPVACLDWDHLETPPFLAFILYHPDKPKKGERHIEDGIEPHREYYRVCRNGAAAFGQKFLRFWLSTTYLADGTTPVTKWEKEYLPKSKQSDTSVERIE